jgi:hypothetical protein
VANIPKCTSVKRAIGGKSAVSWDSQRADGETLSWHLESREDSSMSIMVLDKDSISKDDLIGKCSFPVQGANAEAVWVHLDTGGRVRVQLQQTHIGPTELTKAKMLDLGACGLWSRDGALISSWLVHCKSAIETLSLDDNPDFIGETSSLGTSDVNHGSNTTKKTLSLKQLVRQERQQRAASAKDEEGVSCFKEFAKRLSKLKISQDKNSSKTSRSRGSLTRKDAKFVLRAIRMRGVGMGPRAGSELVTLLSSDFGNNLKKLDISKNPLDQSRNLLADALSSKSAARNLHELTVDLGSSERTLQMPKKRDEAGSPQDCNLRLRGLEMVGHKDAALVAGWMIHCKELLTAIDLSDNPLFVDESLAEEDSETDSADEERLSYSKTSDAWKRLCNALCQTSIQQLFLCDIGMGPKAAQEFAKHIIATKTSKFGGCLYKTLQHLNITGNALEALGKKSIFACIIGTNIETVVVDLGNRPGTAKKQTLERKRKELDLSAQHLGPSDAFALAGWLIHCQSYLRKLILAKNPMLVDEHAISSISDSECVNDTALGDELSSAAAFHHLCSAMRKLALEEISLQHVGLGAHSASALAEILQDQDSLINTSLQNLDVSHNLLGTIGKKSLFAGLDRTQVKTLRVDLGRSKDPIKQAVTLSTAQSDALDVSGRQLHPEDLVLLAGWLTHSKANYTLNLDQNPALVGEIPDINSDGQLLPWEHGRALWLAFCKSLSATSVKTLKLCNIGMGPKCLDILTNVITSWVTLSGISNKGLADAVAPGDQVVQAGKPKACGVVALKGDKGATALTVRVQSGTFSAGEITVTPQVDDAPAFRATAAAVAFTGINTLRSLSISQNALLSTPGHGDHHEFVNFCSVVKASLLQELKIANCGLGPDAIRVVGALLQEQAGEVDTGSDTKRSHKQRPAAKSRTADLEVIDGNITAIDISHNPIFGISEHGIAQSDQWIGTKSNDVNNQGWHSICDAVITPNSKLTSLDASHIGLGPAGLQHLASLLPKKLRLRSLQISGNAIGVLKQAEIKLTNGGVSEKPINPADKFGEKKEYGRAKVQAGVLCIGLPPSESPSSLASPARGRKVGPASPNRAQLMNMSKKERKAATKKQKEAESQVAMTMQNVEFFKPLAAGSCYKVKGAPHRLPNALGEGVWLTDVQTDEIFEREIKYLLRTTDMFLKEHGPLSFDRLTRWRVLKN